jgi:Skp family chaperone for outer membrane proteins
MRIFRLIAATAFLAAIASLPAYAQGTARPSAAQPSVAIGEGKIAIIYSAEFLDQKNGIGRFNALMGTLAREFDPRQKELQGMQTRVQQLTEEINKLQQSGASQVATPQSIQAKVDQLDMLKKDFQRKYEDFEAAVKKRRGEVLGPLQDDIGKALEAFAKQRGITVIIDGSQVPVLYAADSIDITRMFITEYNSRNPATAAAAPTR